MQSCLCWARPQALPAPRDPFPVPPQCYKCAKDMQLVLELDLRGCRVTYKAKRSKKMQHELKVTGASAETLVIGFQSRQQAEDWRKVWRCRSLAELCMEGPRGGEDGEPASGWSQLAGKHQVGLGVQAGASMGPSNPLPHCCPAPGTACSLL